MFLTHRRGDNRGIAAARASPFNWALDPITPQFRSAGRSEKLANRLVIDVLQGFEGVTTYLTCDQRSFDARSNSYDPEAR